MKGYDMLIVICPRRIRPDVGQGAVVVLCDALHCHDTDIQPYALPIFHDVASQAAVHNTHLPPEHQRERLHLPGYFEGPMEPGAHDLKSLAVIVVPAHGPQPR